MVQIKLRMKYKLQYYQFCTEAKSVRFEFAYAMKTTRLKTKKINMNMF
jgi:hypothetical protein